MKFFKEKIINYLKKKNKDLKEINFVLLRENMELSKTNENLHNEIDKLSIEVDDIKKEYGNAITIANNVRDEYKRLIKVYKIDNKVR